MCRPKIGRICSEMVENRKDLCRKCEPTWRSDVDLHADASFDSQF